MLNLKFKRWFKNQKKINKISTKQIILTKINKWSCTDKEISHNSKKFFKIIGLKVYTNFYKKNWDQPIIVQNELGILGIIKNTKNGKYLLQAKVEPGNKNKLQLSPTVQATKSNYNQIHGGKRVPYLKYFLNNTKNKFINQSEQGFRYLYKFNSNVLINVNKKFKIQHNFFWFSLEDLLILIKKKNIMNMDTISVFSSFIKKIKKEIPFISNNKLKSWIRKHDQRFFLKTKVISLKNLKDWIYNNKNITHKNHKHFSVIGINNIANKREVKCWSQPIIKGKDMAFVGFLIKEINGTNHYLCRYILKPGLKQSALSSTINTSDINNYNKNNNLLKFQKIILKDIFLKKNTNQKILYNNILSDEGGRFYHCQIRYRAILLSKNYKLDLPTTYIWVSQNQMIDMIKDKKIDIEGRLLFGCINLSNIK
jgi:oxidase EvaA